MKKILHIDELLSIVKILREEGKSIVTYNGSFDLLHIGHIHSIKEARAQGDVLIILLNSDESIKNYKGPNRPIIHEKDRAEMIAALEDVDYVALFDDINPKSIVSHIKPNIHCNGSDWGENCIERSIVEGNGGKIHVLKWEKGFSTTNLIKKIITIYKMPTIKAVFLDKDGTIHENKNGYIYKKEDITFTPSAVESLQRLSQSDYKIILVTNQSGIARGYYSEEEYERLIMWLKKTLQDKKIRIDAVYHCPHGPEEGCDCRKPGIGMLLQAVKDFGISLNDSWLIGDSESDVITGREANIKTIKLGQKMDPTLKLEPHFYAKTLKDAVTIILD